MGDFEDFKIWYAKSLAQNTFVNADADRKIENTATVGEEIQLMFCGPMKFQKRQTDVSQATAADKTAPDTGTAGSYIKLVFLQKRDTTNFQVLGRLLTLFYLKNSDEDFTKGRIGLENADNPELDVIPTATAGYKFISFMQRPNEDNPSIIQWELELEFLGDHTVLGSR